MISWKFEDLFFVLSTMLALRVMFGTNGAPDHTAWVLLFELATIQKLAL